MDICLIQHALDHPLQESMPGEIAHARPRFRDRLCFLCVQHSAAPVTWSPSQPSPRRMDSAYLRSPPACPVVESVSQRFVLPALPAGRVQYLSRLLRPV